LRRRFRRRHRANGHTVGSVANCRNSLPGCDGSGSGGIGAEQFCLAQALDMVRPAEFKRDRSVAEVTATNGAMSLIGNIVIMFMLVSVLRFNPFEANLITIVICSLINFALADRFVFNS
jgi:hypothetical protein